ncbi:hypothetical protein [Wolbachia endosymbiont of Litomosoides brasiliensis]|nr:hypothetical protein [Wolbachia endosymbiont of Litomosoides brasiliensis]
MLGKWSEMQLRKSGGNGGEWLNMLNAAIFTQPSAIDKNEVFTAS